MAASNAEKSYRTELTQRDGGSTESLPFIPPRVQEQLLFSAAYIGLLLLVGVIAARRRWFS